MEYNEIFKFNSIIMLLILLVVLLVLIIINTKLDIMLYSHIDNKDISININIRALHKLINVTKQIYPLEVSGKETSKKNSGKKKHKKGNNNVVKLKINDIRKIYSIIKKIKIYELYFSIEFGTDYIQLTSFLYVLLNSIYGFMASYLDSEKIYLKVKPDFTKNYIIGETRFQIETTPKELIAIAIEILKVIIKNKVKQKGGKKYEGNRFNTKSDGNNA